MKLLEKKRIFITGGSRGLGRAFCFEMVAQGALVAFNYSKDKDGADKTLEGIQSRGPEGKAFQASVLDSTALETVVRTLEKDWGGIDILINNAGKSQPLPIALMDEEDWDQVMDINVKGHFLASRAVLKGMIRRKSGRILNISSLAGLRLIAAPVHYVTSKAAIKGFTMALSKEVARYNILVNCLAPGLLEEGLGKNLPQHRERDYLKHVALKRKASLEEVAKFAVFLVSDKNTYMNGSTIIMDGGF